MKEINTDITIAGAGLTGLTLACSLAKQNLKIVIIDKHDPKNFLNKAFDYRASAISYGSALILKKIGLWKYLEDNAGKILDIRVTDSESLMHLHYSHKLVGNNPMGYMIENQRMISNFFNHLKKNKNISFIPEVSVKEIFSDNHKAATILENGMKINSELVFAADGTNSLIRKKTGIKAISKDYKQTAIICTVKHEKHHKHIAQERFLSSGPFAILPLKDGYHSSLVWTEKSSLINVFKEMDKKTFMEHLTKRFSNYLGKLQLIDKCSYYPLELKLSKQYASKRILLIGNAAHTMHPIAGQGFNLTLRDIDKITEFISRNSNLGLDIGSPSLIRNYESIRKYDIVTMAIVTDFLNQMFICRNPAIKIARRIGLSLVNKTPYLKKILIQHAMGMLF